MDCAEAKPHLEPYAAGRLQGPDRDDLEQHIATCEACEVEVELLRAPKSPRQAAPGDWTVAKIFDEVAESERAAPDPPAGPTERDGAGDPAAAPPAGGSLFDLSPAATATPPPAATPAQDSGGPRPSNGPGAKRPDDDDWEFEPAGANLDVAPPEESLLLAQEALGTRRDPAQVRSATVRAVLWSVGGLAGFGLLGVSVWIAVSAHQAPAPGAAPPRVADVAPSAPLDPLPGRPGAGPGGGTTPADSAPAPAATPSAAATPGNATIVAATAKPTAATPPLPSPINAPKTRAAAPAPRTAKTPVRAAAPAPEQARAKTPSTSSTPPPVTRGAENDRDDMWPTDAAVAPPPAAAPAPVAPTPRVEPGDAVAAPPPPSASTPPAHEPPTTPTTSSSSPAPDPKIPGTMQRLHEATEQAAAAADIDGLRRLRDAWRDYARSVVGPNRSLAKREYADCLWAVQLLTGRTDDQRDAAHAYRDFLLSAPAGGTDSRSAVRLRQLEDVLAERR